MSIEPESRAQLKAAAAASFAEAHPRAALYNSGSRITRVYGSKFGGGSSPEDAAEQFRINNAVMFGVEPADLRPQSLLKDRRHTQPVMYNRETGEYKFTMVYFSQFKDDIPVFRADLRLLARNEEGSPLVLASANLRDLGDFSPALDNLKLDDSSVWETAARELMPALVNFTAPELVIWAGVDDTVVQPTLAVTFTGNNRGAPQSLPTEAWRFVADAATGAILHRETLIHHFIDVCGNVSGKATQGIGADLCEAEALVPMPYARVNIFFGASAFADENGDFCIDNGGTDPMTVQSRVWGQYFRVHNYNGTSKHADHSTDTLLSQLVTPPGPADFVHNQANDDEFERAEVNGYIYANEIRNNWIVQANPDYPTISTETEFTVNVNREAIYAGRYIAPGLPGGPSINFGMTSIWHQNAAFSAIIYHEYGHHVVEMGGSGQGQYGEGMGDTMSVIIHDNPCVGFGVDSDCDATECNGCGACGICTCADNVLQYPCSGGVHDCGQLLSGCVWDTRNALVANEVSGYQDILMSLAVNSVQLHSGTEITPQITIDWLILDDDDTCFWDGTPHYNEICTGFGAHNMDCPCLADFNGDGEVEAFDLGFLLGSWGPCPAPPAACLADLDCDGTVEAADLAILLGSWGPCTGGGDSGGGGGDGSLTLEEALALMDYESVDEFIDWIQSETQDQVLEAAQYLHSLLTDGP